MSDFEWSKKKQRMKAVFRASVEAQKDWNVAIT
jgi:hypothetical protein